jgi:hypothetical protein
MRPHQPLRNQRARNAFAARARAAQRSAGRIFVIARRFHGAMFIWNLHRG